MFPKLPQSSQTESLGFPRNTPSPWTRAHYKVNLWVIIRWWSIFASRHPLEDRWWEKQQTNWYIYSTPPKSNIDTKKWWFGKCISFQTWLFWVSMLDFMGVYNSCIYAQHIIISYILDHTVDGSEIRRAPVAMVNIPLYTTGFKNIPGGCLGFLNHQKYHAIFVVLLFFQGNPSCPPPKLPPPEIRP